MSMGDLGEDALAMVENYALCQDAKSLFKAKLTLKMSMGDLGQDA